MTRTTSAQITKSKDDIKYCKDQEVAQRSDKQNSVTKEMNDRGKTFHN